MLDLLTIFGYNRWLTFFSIISYFLFSFRDKYYWKLSIHMLLCIRTWYNTKRRIKLFLFSLLKNGDFAFVPHTPIQKFILMIIVNSFMMVTRQQQFNQNKEPKINDEVTMQPFLIKISLPTWQRKFSSACCRCRCCY